MPPSECLAITEDDKPEVEDDSKLLRPSAKTNLLKHDISNVQSRIKIVETLRTLLPNTRTDLSFATKIQDST